MVYSEKNKTFVVSKTPRTTTFGRAALRRGKVDFFRVAGSRRKTKQKENGRVEGERKEKKVQSFFYSGVITRRRTRGSRCANQRTALEIVNADTALVARVTTRRRLGTGIRVGACVCTCVRVCWYRGRPRTSRPSPHRSDAHLNGQIKRPGNDKVCRAESQNHVTYKRQDFLPFPPFRPSRAQ